MPHEPDASTALATVIIAIFTVALAWVNWRQAGMARETIDLARKEFQTTHRPRIVTRTFQIVGRAGPSLITFVYVNLPAKW